jgi:hypothetical protein
MAKSAGRLESRSSLCLKSRTGDSKPPTAGAASPVAFPSLTPAPGPVLSTAFFQSLIGHWLSSEKRSITTQTKTAQFETETAYSPIRKQGIGGSGVPPAPAALRAPPAPNHNSRVAHRRFRKTTYLHLLAIIVRWSTLVCPSLPLVHYFQRTLGVAPCPSLPDRPHTATPTACDSNLDSGNHDMSRLSAFAYLNDAPIHALPTSNLYACSQRVLGVVPCPSLPDQTHNTTTSAKLALSRPENYLRAARVDFCHSACIRLAATSPRPLFLTRT